MGILSHIKEEWGILKSAPAAFVLLLVLGVGAGFVAGTWLMRQEVANAESLVRLKDGELAQKNGEIDGYRKTIEERLGKIEKQLSVQQINAIQSELSKRPSTVNIVGPQPKDESAVAKQILETFKNSGWDVQTQYATQDKEPAGWVLRSDQKDSITTIGKALSGAGISYEAITNPSTGKTDIMLGSGPR